MSCQYLQTKSSLDTIQIRNPGFKMNGRMNVLKAFVKTESTETDVPNICFTLGTIVNGQFQPQRQIEVILYTGATYKEKLSIINNNQMFSTYCELVAVYDMFGHFDCYELHVKDPQYDYIIISIANRPQQIEMGWTRNEQVIHVQNGSVRFDSNNSDRIDYIRVESNAFMHPTVCLLFKNIDFAKSSNCSLYFENVLNVSTENIDLHIVDQYDRPVEIFEIHLVVQFFRSLRK